MPDNGLRQRWVLGKFYVVAIERGVARISLGGTTEMRIPIPPRADLRVGDLLTYYTEVPLAIPS